MGEKVFNGFVAAVFVVVFGPLILALGAMTVFAVIGMWGVVFKQAGALLGI